MWVNCTNDRINNFNVRSFDLECWGSIFDQYALLMVSNSPNVTQLSTFACSHNSKCDCKMLKVEVIIRKVTAKC